jgi:nitrite reductase/ring-hydroxylating ferredoxin subunit
MSTINRREFVATGLGACVCALCPAAARAGGPAEGPAEIGAATDFPRDGAYDRWAAGGFFVVRRGGRLYALSSTCTHKDVQIVLKGKALRCPKHGSVFSLEGDVTKAPANRPLERFAISVDSEGRISVDPGRRFDKKRWGDPECFVEL